MSIVVVFNDAKLSKPRSASGHRKILANRGFKRQAPAAVRVCGFLREFYSRAFTKGYGVIYNVFAAFTRTFSIGDYHKTTSLDTLKFRPGRTLPMFLAVLPALTRAIPRARGDEHVADVEL